VRFLLLESYALDEDIPKIAVAAAASTSPPLALFVQCCFIVAWQSEDRFMLKNKKNKSSRPDRRTADSSIANKTPAAAASKTVMQRRSGFLAGLILVVLLAVFAWLGYSTENAFLPVSVEVAGPNLSFRVYTAAPRLAFVMSQEQLGLLQSVDVGIGDQQFHFNREQFVKEWSIGFDPSGEQCQVVAPSRLHSPPPRFFTSWQCINWPGDWGFLWRALPMRLLIVTLLLGAFFGLLRLPRFQQAERWLLNGFSEDSPSSSAPDESAARRWGWFFFGAAVLAAGIVIVECNQSYYFTQDDNFSYILDVVVPSFRQMLAGQFPEWNACQLLGSPLASLGEEMLYYPPLYLSYAIARWGFGNESLTLEIFAILHLAAGYAATFWAARRIGMRASLAAVGSLCFLLSGYLLLVGRTAINIMPMAVWGPLLMVCMDYFAKKKIGWKWTVVTGVAIAPFFYVGFPQYWLYVMISIAVIAVVLKATNAVSWQKLGWFTAAVFLGAGLCCPLLWMQFQWASDIVRPPAYGYGIEKGFLAALLPYPLTFAPFPELGWGNGFRELRGQMYYSGTLFFLATLLGLGVLVAYRWRRASFAQNVWLLCAGVLLLLCLGKPGGLSTIISHLPILSKTSNNPYRAMCCFLMLSSLGGGLFLERILRHVSRHRVWECVLAGSVALLLLHHAFCARSCFYLFADKPYPKMPEAMAALLNPTDITKKQRVISVSPRVSAERDFPLSLNAEFASYYSVYSFNGYDPLVESKPQSLHSKRLLYTNPVAAIQAYGIRWIIIPRMLEKPLPSLVFDENYVHFGELLQVVRNISRPALELPNLTIREVSEVAPMVFSMSEPTRCLPYRVLGDGILADVSKCPSESVVVVNFQAWPAMNAKVDGRPAKVTADQWGRINVAVPNGARELLVCYSPRWGEGFLLGGCVAAIGVLIGVGVRRIPSRKDS
jgi:hypothetical protein